jgi:hypothetical protein
MGRWPSSPGPTIRSSKERGDFLLAFGDASIGGCGEGAEYDYNFGFYAEPRKLYTLVAILEPKEKEIQIKRMGYIADPDEQLRKLREPTQPQDSPPGVIPVKKGEMAVISLRIELRYDLDEFEPLMDANAAKGVYEKI